MSCTAVYRDGIDASGQAEPRPAVDLRSPDPNASLINGILRSDRLDHRTSGGAAAPSLQHRNGGTLDFASGVVPADDTNQLSFRMSDNFPFWIEFDLKLHASVG